MRISVALCTYNGASYVTQQLQSIAAQTRLPHELVVCDDGSTDGTADLVREFAACAPFEVRCEVNPVNLGSTASFDLALSRCQGEVIVLSDQDDMWMPRKLESAAQVFDADPTVGLLCSDAALVDEHLRPLGSTLWQVNGFTAGQRRRFNQGEALAVLLRRHCVTGATAAFRTSFLDLIRPIPRGWVHDGWIALLVAALAPCRTIEVPLILYRQHAGQQIGARPRSIYQQFEAGRRLQRTDFERIANQFELAVDRLSRYPGVTADRLQSIHEKVLHYRQRARMRDAGVWRWPLIAREAFARRYSRFSQGWKAMAMDLLFR